MEIHTFEPSRANHLKLQDRFRDDDKIHIPRLAVSDVAGPATLFSNKPGSGLGSLTKRRLEHFNIPFDTTEAIQTIRFKDYWREQLGSRRLDIVKIDIEGHELDALRGFGNAIHASRIIQFELGGCNIDTRTFFQDFWRFFKEHNFQLFRVTPFGAEFIERYRELDEFFLTTNFIAVNRETV